jgi:hypothetical protein
MVLAASSPLVETRVEPIRWKTTWFGVRRTVKGVAFVLKFTFLFDGYTTCYTLSVDYVEINWIRTAGNCYHCSCCTCILTGTNYPCSLLLYSFFSTWPDVNVPSSQSIEQREIPSAARRHVAIKA